MSLLPNDLPKLKVTDNMKRRIVDSILGAIGVFCFGFIIWAFWTQPVFVMPEEPKPQQVTVVNNYYICATPPIPKKD